MTALIDEHRAAEILGVSVKTLRGWRHQCARGKCTGPPHVKIGRAVRYDLADVEAFIAKNKVTANG
jgi:predicted DNA-binding transcriptional regulator AlpA